MYGYDWEKISTHFESRTAIMVKNRFYHIKKKNILQSLLNEVEANIIVTPEEIPLILEHPNLPETCDDTLHYFTQRGEEILSQKLKIWSDDTFSMKFEEQLCDKISPLGDWNNENNSNFIEEENYYSFTSFMGFNQRFIHL